MAVPGTGIHAFQAAGEGVDARDKREHDVEWAELGNCRSDLAA
jgi:hypothetical protein